MSEREKLKWRKITKVPFRFFNNAATPRSLKSNLGIPVCRKPRIFGDGRKPTKAIISTLTHDFEKKYFVKFSSIV